MLGVTSTASRDEIRLAYRVLARQHHPDAQGDISQQRMAQINEAWRVLSDPARRSMYDATRRSNGSAATPRRSAPAHGPTPTAVHPPPLQPARFPWRFLLVLATLGIAFVLVNAALTKPPSPVRPDNVLSKGSCVAIDPNGDAREVLCNGVNDSVVDELIDSDGTCAVGTEAHRDRQGMGTACVRMASSP